MGSGPSHDAAETKVADSTGTVNNNILLNPVPIQSREIVILLSIICGIKALELAMYVYREHKKFLKKRYVNNPN